MISLVLARRSPLRSRGRQLGRLHGEARPLEPTHRGLPRVATTISWSWRTAAITRIKFDPFMVHLVRVVDTSNKDCASRPAPTCGLDQSRLTGWPRRYRSPS